MPGTREAFRRLLVTPARRPVNTCRLTTMPRPCQCMESSEETASDSPAPPNSRPWGLACVSPVRHPPAPSERSPACPLRWFRAQNTLTIICCKSQLPDASQQDKGQQIPWSQRCHNQLRFLRLRPWEESPIPAQHLWTRGFHPAVGSPSVPQRLRLYGHGLGPSLKCPEKKRQPQPKGKVRADPR